MLSTRSACLYLSILGVCAMANASTPTMVPTRPTIMRSPSPLQGVQRTRSMLMLARRKETPEVPVFLMMPLDTLDPETKELKASAAELLPGAAAIGAEGIMVDVWWGLCEQEPGVYNFTGYVELLKQCRALGLKVQTVMSFHACGGNIGDDVNIPIPKWVTDLEFQVPELFYRDQRGDPSREYISLSCDELPRFPGKRWSEEEEAEAEVERNRTGLELYEDFMQAFRNETKDFGRDGTLVEIQVGCGPCGELRYPSYPLSPREHYPDGWAWPGIGELQCYDRGMYLDMKKTLGRERPPILLGEYSDAPDDTKFWTKLPNQFTIKEYLLSLLQASAPTKYPPEHFSHPSGEAFLAWYSNRLIEHGDKVMGIARGVFGPTMRLAAKVSGIHWLRAHPSHAAEETAGYHANYLDRVCAMLAKTKSVLDFTCFEMRAHSQPSFALCQPELLVQSAAEAAHRAGVEFAGENALFCWTDEGQIEQIEAQCELAVRGGVSMAGFTVLRLEHWLLIPGSGQRAGLERFVANMKDLSRRKQSRSPLSRLRIATRRAYQHFMANQI